MAALARERARAIRVRGVVGAPAVTRVPVEVVAASDEHARPEDWPIDVAIPRPTLTRPLAVPDRVRRLAARTPEGQPAAGDVAQVRRQSAHVVIPFAYARLRYTS